MMQKPNRVEPKLFYHGISLQRRIPQDHLLRKVKKFIDFTFAYSEVKGLYSKNGNESIDPSVNSFINSLSYSLQINCSFYYLI
jgi:hypothetical protein